ncbi:MAG TPA: hypothetical protein VGL34_15545 [Steroidobacteraceae bacterium]|jgi:hypothetical protein
MVAAQECRENAAQCSTLERAPDISIQRATILRAIARSWTALAGQMDRYEAIGKDEAK